MQGNFCFESGVAMVWLAGWPATADGWAVVGGWAQGGVIGVFRSRQSPADRLARPGEWSPWGLRRSDGLRTMGILGGDAGA